jgi:PAS domain-containing protein
MVRAIQSAAIRPARRLAFRIAAAVMLVQAAVFCSAGTGYLLWFENNLETDANDRVLAPGRLIQSGQMGHSMISNRQRMQDIVGVGLVDALLVGINGNIFHALEPSLLGRQVSSLENIDPAWFRDAGNSPELIRHAEGGYSYMIGITPLITFDNIEPFLYAYVKLDATVIDREKEQMRVAVVTAVLFGMLVTTVVIYGAFEWLLFRRIKNAVRMIDKENNDSDDLDVATTSSDELGLVELGVRRISADRKRERSLRAEAETALVEVQARADSSTSAAKMAEMQAQRAQSLIDAVPGGLVTIDQAGTVLTCNDTAAQGLGRPTESIVGRSLAMFLRPVGDGPPKRQRPETSRMSAGHRSAHIALSSPTAAEARTRSRSSSDLRRLRSRTGSCCFGNRSTQMCGTSLSC